MTTAQQRGTQPSPTAGGPAYSWSPPRQLRRRPPLRRLPHQLGPAPADLSVEAAREQAYREVTAWLRATSPMTTDRDGAERATTDEGALA